MNGLMNGKKSLSFLRNDLSGLLDDIPFAHCSRDVSEYLIEVSPNKWIVRNGPVK